MWLMKLSDKINNRKNELLKDEQVATQIAELFEEQWNPEGAIIARQKAEKYWEELNNLNLKYWYND